MLTTDVVGCKIVSTNVKLLIFFKAPLRQLIRKSSLHARKKKNHVHGIRRKVIWSQSWCVCGFNNLPSFNCFSPVTVATLRCIVLQPVPAKSGRQDMQQTAEFGVHGCDAGRLVALPWKEKLFPSPISATPYWLDGVFWLFLLLYCFGKNDASCTQNNAGRVRGAENSYLTKILCLQFYKLYVYMSTSQQV